MEINEPKFVITQTPGKILVCGGYLVISPQYRGLIFNSETYFRCEGKFLEIDSKTKKENKHDENLVISVFSHDFNQTFQYKLTVKYESNLNQLDINLIQFEGLDNRFVEFSILNSFYFFFLNNFGEIEKIYKNYSNFIKENFLQINLKADYRFYTYDTSMSNKTKVKTGLGSSSGLICSLNTNLFILLSKIFQENKDYFIKIKDLRELNKEHQACILLSSYFSNNQAQKKIGSGFDIQSCLLGSQIFQRKNIAEDFVIKGNSNPEEGLFYIINQSNVHKYFEISNEFINSHLNKIRYIKFPPNLKSCLISIECGSDTRLLVSKVIKWAEANKTKEIFDNKIFQEINQINEDLIDIFVNNNEMNNELISQIQKINIGLRRKLRVLSDLTGVEIQPEILSNLMNSLEKNGIIFSICPGAGGFDGVFVMSLVENFEEIVNNSLMQFNESNSNFKAFYIPIDITENGTIIE